MQTLVIHTQYRENYAAHDAAHVAAAHAARDTATPQQDQPAQAHPDVPRATTNAST